MTKTPKPYGARVSLLLAPATFLVAVATVLLLGLFGPALMEALLPTIGEAFETDRTVQTSQERETASTRNDPCDLIVGPAKDYCERGDGAKADKSGPDFDCTEVLMLAPAVIGLGLVWAVGRRR